MGTTHALNGALTWSNADKVLLQAGLLQAACVDLSGVTQVDSAGIALLLELQRRASARGATLKLAGAPAQLRRMSAFFDVDSLLSFQD